jgi:hypothetical protein
MKAEQGNKLVEKVDVIYMRPTDFSPMKLRRMRQDSSDKYHSLNPQ